MKQPSNCDVNMVENWIQPRQPKLYPNFYVDFLWIFFKARCKSLRTPAKLKAHFTRECTHRPWAEFMVDRLLSAAAPDRSPCKTGWLPGGFSAVFEFPLPRIDFGP